MKKFNILAATLAVILVLGAGIGSAMAYFTTYVKAEGGMVIHLGNKQDITEEWKEGSKHVKIKNLEESQPVYIRARAYAGSLYQLDYSGSDERWELNEEDGWYYYKDIVPAGGNTEDLLVKIKNVPREAEEGDSFNIAVVYESTLVRYRTNAEGETETYADWDEILDAEVNGGE